MTLAWTVDGLAHELHAAAQARVGIAPLSERHPDLTIDDAYAIQQVQLREQLAAGARLVGHKVGLTSRAMQVQLGVDQPDFGFLTHRMLHAEHQPIDVSQFLQPRIEPEVAFVLARPLAGPTVTAAEAVAAVDFVLPALEIIDSRIADWRIGIIDTIADNASSAGVVLGSTPTRLDAVDLRLSGCVFRRNGEVVGTGAGGAVMGSPINALVWLANTVSRFGVTLEAGHVILPGAQTAAAPVAAGDAFTAAFGGIGSVTARFVPQQDAR